MKYLGVIFAHAPGMVKDSTLHRGLDAELRAQKFLEEKGYRFIEKNFRWKRGEIDLVMQDQATLVFVEVRSAKKSSPWLRSSITPQKQRHLMKSIDVYAARWPWVQRLPKRFDMIWIEGERIEHWKNVALMS